MNTLIAWLRSASAGGGSDAARYSLALGATLAAAIVGAALTPWLGSPIEYVTFYLTVVLVGVAAGRRPALCTAGILTVVAASVWVGSAHRLVPASVDVVRLITFAIGGSAMAVIGGHLRDASHRVSVLED